MIVNYAMILRKRKIGNSKINLVDSKKALEKTLKEITEFAFKHKKDNWGKQFQLALDKLASTNPEEGFYYKDLIPLDNYSMLAKQVLYGAGFSWVFSPHKSSWNNLEFEINEEKKIYIKLTEQLYENINKGIISAVNKN